jgi:MoxR-like ATPase
MSPSSELLSNHARRFRKALAGAAHGLIEREALVELVALSAIAGEHVLVIGPPGTAKSEAARRVAATLGARYFEYLLSRFTEPSEIFGPVDLRRLLEGVVETETAGMLPEAEVAFLDEVFLGSTAILNTLLAILNERIFRRGSTVKRCPLRICVGASNVIPDDEALAAFADRFLVRVFVEPIGDPQLEQLMEGGWSLLRSHAAETIELAQLDLLAEAARSADVSAIRPRLAHAVRQLRAAGITLSDRRIVKLQSLVAAAAVLGGRAAPTEADLWPIVYAVPTAAGQRTAREVLRELLAASENSSLPVAAADASMGPLARAAIIVRAGRELLSQRPHDGEATAQSAWRLRLEGIAREIDAGFAPEAAPAELRDVRAAIVAELTAAG